MLGNHKALSDLEIASLKSSYKMIEVPSFDYYQINVKMFGDEYLETTMNQKVVMDRMLFYYMRHHDVDLFKRTDYICNEKEKICICNTGAEELRILNGGTKNNQKFISWFISSSK